MREREEERERERERERDGGDKTWDEIEGLENRRRETVGMTKCFLKNFAF